MATDRVRWGLLSTARINERLIPALRDVPRAELVAVASRDQARADAYARERGIPRAFGSYEAMLAEPEVDAVYISLPNSLHEEWTVKAADAGKHVLCEKPLALSVEEVDNMAAAARRNNVVVQEAAMYRFHPQTQQLQQLIAEGAIGDVRLIQSTFSFTLSNLGDVRLDPGLGGGALWDIGSYPVSFSRTIMRSNPVEVSACETESERGVDLSLSGQMRFQDGAVAQFFCSFQAITHWSVTVIGSQGHVSLDLPWTNQPGESGRLRLVAPGQTTGASAFGDSTDHLTESEQTFGPRSAYHYQIDSMNASILDASPPVISLEDSRGNVATINALLRAADERRVVALA